MLFFHFLFTGPHGRRAATVGLQRMEPEIPGKYIDDKEGSRVGVKVKKLLGWKKKNMISNYSNIQSHRDLTIMDFIKQSCLNQ